MPATERRDLFGRTEAELRAEIARKERIYAIAASYSGGEGQALKLAVKKANLDVDRRQLAIMLGEAVDESPPLSPAARASQNKTLAAFERFSLPKRG
jgi:hypothetical protein